MLQVLIHLIKLLKKIRFVTLKAELDKLDINKLINVSTSLNKLSTKEDDLGVDKFKTVPADLKKLTDVVDNQVVKNIKFNTLRKKVNKIDKIDKLL